MSRRPSRAKMCNWLSGQLYSLAGRTMPFNPADVKQMTYNARDVDTRLHLLSIIAGELGWHVDADLDVAWELIHEYEKLPPREIADEYRPARKAADREPGTPAAEVKGEGRG